MVNTIRQTGKTLQSQPVRPIPVRVRDLTKPRHKQAFTVVVNAATVGAARESLAKRLKPQFRLCRWRAGGKQ